MLHAQRVINESQYFAFYYELKNLEFLHHKYYMRSITKSGNK